MINNETLRKIAFQAWNDAPAYSEEEKYAGSMLELATIGANMDLILSILEDEECTIPAQIKQYWIGVLKGN